MRRTRESDNERRIIQTHHVMEESEQRLRKEEEVLDQLVMAEEHASIVSHPLFESMQSLYLAVAHLNDDTDDGVVTKDELIRCHGGDYHLFESLDEDSNGRVTFKEWTHYIASHRHALESKKAGRGDDWVRHLVSTLETNIKIVQLEKKNRVALSGMQDTVSRED